MTEHDSAEALVLEKSRSLTKAERLLKRREFVAIQRSGRRFYSRLFIVCWAPGPNPWARLGVTVSRKLGNAVRRNRAKRLIREAFRLNKECLPAATDIVIIASPSLLRMGLDDVSAELVAWATERVRRRSKR